MSAAKVLGPVGEAALKARNPDRRHPFQNTSDAGLISALTGTGQVGSAALIERFGSLHRLARATATELEAAGLSAEAAGRLTAGVALGMRVTQRRFEPGQVVRSDKSVIERFRPRMMLSDRESMMALLLDTRNQVIGEMEISLGGLNFANMTPREVFAHALRENAASLVLVHNHPTGNPEPSRSDVEFTERMLNVGKALHMNILDSIVVGSEGGVSLRREYPHLFYQERGYNIAEAVADAGRPIQEIAAEPVAAAEAGANSELSPL